jgi:type IX secretion system PorP/SprF family membrane protein
MTIYGQRIWNSSLGQYAFNPAGGGMSDIASISSSYYNTYGSANNSPYGFLLMGTSPFASDNIAAGFCLTTESGGVLNNTMAEGTFIYRVPILKNSKLSFGISAVYNQMSILRDRLNPQDPNDPILNAATSGFWGDANFGVSLYETNKYHIGLAVYNLLDGSTSWRVENENFTDRAARLYSFSGMYTFDVLKGEGKLEFNGIALSYLSEGSTSVNYDIDSRLIIKKLFWVGAGYEPKTVKFLFGVYFQNFSVGYEGGIGLGDITKYTYVVPQNELFLKIDFNNSKASRSQPSKI